MLMVDDYVLVSYIIEILFSMYYNLFWYIW